MNRFRPKAVILAGGKGTRIAEETAVRPKPLVEIGGRPILWHVMKTYSHYGVNDFIICCGYLGHQIKQYFLTYAYQNADITIDIGGGGDVHVHQSNVEPWRVTLVDTGQETMTGGRIRRVADYISNDPYFCLTYGDGISDVNISALIDFHESHGRKATVTAVAPLARFGALEIEGAQVRHFVEKPPTEGGLINGGYFVLSPDVISLIDGDDCIFEQTPLVTLAERGDLMAFRHTGFWQPMDTMRDKLHLEELWQQGAPWLCW